MYCGMYIDMGTDQAKRVRSTRLAPRELSILQILSKRNKPTSSLELFALLGNSSQQVVTRDLQRLTQKGYVKRLPGEGRSFKYIFQSWGDKLSPVGKGLDVPRIEPLDAANLLSIYKAVTQENWEPKIFTSVGQLPEVMSQIFYMADQVREGEVISKQDLVNLKAKVREMFEHVNILQRVVGGLYVTDKLWNPATLGSHL